MTDKKDDLLKQRSPWSKNNNTIWLASNIALRRNIEKFRFPGKLNVERRKQIIQVISNEILSSSTLKNALLLKGEEVGPLEKEFLLEHTLSSESFQGAHQGEAFIVDESGAFLCALNIKDHIHFQEVDIKGDIESAWRRLMSLESKIGERLPYAYSSQFGFLTADPFECGTGLHATLFLQPSALIHTGKLAQEIDAIEDSQILLQHFLGQKDAHIGDMVVVTNNYTLGFNEETILSAVKNWSMKLIEAERTLRRKIASEESAEMKDKVARAWAVLIHSYQIETQEALNALALVKLGCDLKWIGGIEISALNELFFNCRRAHLQRLFPEQITPEQLPHKRAEFIHQSLKGTELLV